MLLAKENYLFYYKLDLRFNDLNFIDFTLHFSFYISTVTQSRKLVLLQPHGRKNSSAKNTNLHIVSKSLTKIKVLFSRWPHSKSWTQPQTAKPIDSIF